MSRSFSPLPWRTLLASALLATLATWPRVDSRAAQADQDAPKADAQDKDKDKDKTKEKDEAKKPAAVTVAAPTAFRVYQRNSENRAEIPIVLRDATKDDAVIGATINGQFLGGPPGLYRDGRFVGVPVGGPYTINFQVAKVEGTGPDGTPVYAGDTVRNFTVGPVYVGDLWVLAGQSNMEGYGDLAELQPPHDQVLALGMNGQWARAEEPLHWLEDSPDEVHSGDQATRAERAAGRRKSRTKGAGLGLAFGGALAATTNVPVGLVPCAHGGTSMEQWNPEKKGEGGKSLYGSMVRQVKEAGGKVRGVLWYQGEADANNGGADEFGKRFTDFIAAVRSDLDDPDLPFYYVQIGRWVKAHDPKGWNTVQNAQRLLPERVANTAVVASIDLELDDGIHVGTQGLKRLGFRLARIAQREVFGQAGGTTPTFERVTRRGTHSLLVKFKGVNRTPMADGNPTFMAPGMEGSRMGMPGMMPPGMMGMAGAGQLPLGGLRPARHIGGFSIRQGDGTEIPLIFDAAVGPAKDTVLLKLADKIPDGAHLWYGYGLDPYCNLTDGLDMAVPAFGPIALDDVK